MTDSNELLLKIARCQNMNGYYANKLDSQKCKKVIESQNFNSIEKFHLPEPWNGNIQNAPILFISSNPSISSKDNQGNYLEQFPINNWPNHQIIDFFTNRFGGGEKEWVKDGRYSLQTNGTHSSKGTSYWINMRNRSAELLDRDPEKVIMGIDFASTELVHCKSRSEIGYNDALTYCTEQYFSAILDISTAKVVICVGASTGKYVRDYFGFPDSKICVEDLEGKKRYFVFLPRNISSIGKISNNLDEVEVAQIKRVLNRS